MTAKPESDSSDYDDGDDWAITHWMPLPTPPAIKDAAKRVTK